MEPSPPSNITNEKIDNYLVYILTQMNIKDLLGAAGVVSGLITFIIGISNLPQGDGQVPPNESPQDFSRKQHEAILNSSEFRIMMCGIGVTITSYMYVCILRYCRDNLVIDLPLATPKPVTVAVPQLKPILKTVRIAPEVKQFRYPPPYELFNKRLELHVEH